MSGAPACQCSEKHEPIQAPKASNRPGRLWRVVRYHCNYSAFNGYRRTYSPYSAVCCLHCGASWRTKSNYVALLPQLTEAEKNIAPGYPSYAEAMEARGRKPCKYRDNPVDGIEKRGSIGLTT